MHLRYNRPVFWWLALACLGIAAIGAATTVGILVASCVMRVG